jgi:DNA-binding CsgD family transcriptional regulator
VPTPPLDPEQEKRRLFDAICDFLLALSSANPLLVIVEDLHWSDDTSLDFLLYMARRIVSRPILLVITYRSDEARPLTHFLATLDRERLPAELHLDRLTQTDVDSMIRAIFDLQRPTRGDFLDTIYSLTEGNAFFIEEVLKSLTTSGGIFYTEGAWERKPVEELNIPRTVHDSVQRRAEGLSEAGRRTLARAAVLGRRFDFAILQALTGYDETGLLAIIKELIGAQLIVEETADHFAFRHALTREAIYSELLARERRSLHRTIAQTIQQVYADSLDVHVADLAYHCYEAGMWAEALEYSWRAGENAQALYSPRAAIEHFGRAIDAARKIGAGVPAPLYRSRGAEHEVLGEFDQALSDYEEALTCSRHHMDPREEWEALLFLGKLWAGRNYGKAGDYFQQALNLARSVQDDDHQLTTDEDRARLAHSLNRVGNWYANIDRPDEAVPLHLEALDIFGKLGDRAGTAQTVDLLGMTTNLKGDLVQGFAYYRRAVELFTQLGDRQALCSTLAMSPICSGTFYQGNTVVGADLPSAEGLQSCLQALEIACDIAWRSGEASALWMAGFCQGAQGDYGRALENTERALVVATEIDHLQWMAAAGGALGGILVDIYALERAHDLLEETLVLAKQSGSVFLIRNTTSALVQCCVAQQDYARARDLLDEVTGPEPAEFPYHTLAQRNCWQARVELALAVGEYAAALQMVERLYADAKNLTETADQGIPRLAMLRGQALMSLGTFDEAEGWLLGAMESARARNTQSLVWRIHARLGGLYQATGRGEQARQSLGAAQALLEQLASTLPDEEMRAGYLQGAASEFPRASTKQTASSRRTALQTPGGLTARELEVALLVAQGKTNREIAAELILGERTIETHVGNALSKLGFTSRAQIAAWAVENVRGKVQ